VFAIAFDLVVADAERNHPSGVSQAYADIRRTLGRYRFEGVQGSVYLNESDDMANLVAAILALKSLTWFPGSVRDVRPFKVESWSDFTPIVKG
jgi:virulence-associated protein VapD